MSNIYTVSFFGHRTVDNLLYIEGLLEKIIEKLIKEKECIEFLVGRNGQFDISVSSSILRVEKRIEIDNNLHILVLPYSTSEYRNNKKEYERFYDEIEIYDSPKGFNYKYSFQKRNQYMIDRSHLVIFYVENNYGGAFQSLQYALKKKKNIINLAQMISDTEI